MRRTRVESGPSRSRGRFLIGFGFPAGIRLVSTISTGPTPWFWGIDGGARDLAASVALVTSIAFSIDTTLTIGAACYLLVAAPAVLLVFAGGQSNNTALRSLHPPKSPNAWNPSKGCAARATSSHERRKANTPS
jgi:hypothetical protein